MGLQSEKRLDGDQQIGKLTDAPVYVFCKDFNEFFKFQKEYPNLDSHYIVGINWLTGRTAGHIVRYGKWEENKSILAIEFDIQLFNREWGDTLTKLANSQSGFVYGEQNDSEVKKGEGGVNKPKQKGDFYIP